MCKFCGPAVRSSSDLSYHLVAWDFISARMVLQVGISSESALAEALPPCLLCAVAGCSACLIHVRPQVYRAWCVIMLGSMIPCTCCTCLKHRRHSQLSSPSLRGDPISPPLKSPPPLAFERPPIGPLSLLGGSYSPGSEDTVWSTFRFFWSKERSEWTRECVRSRTATRDDHVRCTPQRARVASTWLNWKRRNETDESRMEGGSGFESSSDVAGNGCGFELGHGTSVATFVHVILAGAGGCVLIPWTVASLKRRWNEQRSGNALHKVNGAMPNGSDGWSWTSEKGLAFLAIALCVVSGLLGHLGVGIQVFSTGGCSDQMASNHLRYGHAIFGWLLVLLFTIHCLAHYTGIGKTFLRGLLCGMKSSYTALVEERSTLPNYLCFGFGLTNVLLAALVVPATGLWLVFGCMNKSIHSFIGDEIGHVIPATCFAVTANMSLLYMKPKDRLKLQFREGLMMICLGTFYILQITIWHEGGVLHFLFYPDNPRPPMHRMKDQQHTFSAVLWLACGTLGIGLGKMKYKTGIHWLLAGLGQSSMMLFHPQPNLHAKTGHLIHGALMLVATLFRYAFRFPEFALFTTLSGIIFVATSPCLVMWAAGTGVEVIGYQMISIAIGTILWIYHFTLWRSPTDIYQAEDSNI